MFCQNSNKCHIDVPDENNKYIFFKNYKHKEKVPFVLYADFECLLTKQNEQLSNKITSYQKHIPYNCAYYLHCSFDETISKFESYRGKDCVD